MTTIYYKVPSECEESTYELSTDLSPASLKYGRVLGSIAKECAEDYFNDHDGWESTWPMTFTLHLAEDGPIIGKFNVDMEQVPAFFATSMAE
ncbi:hypothetical protein EUZ85_19495 [Hahella sp. KA22]|uniref:hypothetical protein n=1 Tax=Hahella sp. KA22 TaxID=1628392 RepID=UPI000FDDDF5D|nr:hypothetical protein [Hahella sp. KA22]AZZ92789.1 hypothetical protein ENC22_16915 [Hahella sp. KA22]QAY56163.1 hypothetical protein EUZ85_19495 [Hahella sp. KA22]